MRDTEKSTALGYSGPICVMTRVRVRGLLGFLRFVRYYRRVSRTLDGTPGLIHVGLLAEGPLTWHMLSVWRSEEPMMRWAGVREHVDAVRKTYGTSDMTDESWSGRWRLEAVSPTARRWTRSPAMEQPLQNETEDVGRDSVKPTRQHMWGL